MFLRPLLVLSIGTLFACSEPTTVFPENTASQAVQTATVRIETERGRLDVRTNPQRIAVYDWAALDTLHQLGVPIGASTEKVMVDYLAPVFEKTQQVGTLFEPNYEKLSAYQPDLIITGGPGAVAYDELAKIAPTIDMTIDNQNIRDSAKARLDAFGQIFNKQSQANQLKTQIDQSFAKARQGAQGMGSAMVVSITGRKISAMSPQSRLASWIHQDIGMASADKNLKNSAHGQLVSFEYIRDNNPDWIFVLDRTSSLGEKGDAAIDVLNNPLVNQTTAWKKSQIIIMPNANYIVAGGVKQLLQASQQLTDAFEKAKQSNS